MAFSFGENQKIIHLTRSDLETLNRVITGIIEENLEPNLS